MTSATADADWISVATQAAALRPAGKVAAIAGPVLTAHGISGAVGQQVVVHAAGRSDVPAEIIGLREDAVLCMGLDTLEGIQVGDPVVVRASRPGVLVGEGLLGRIVDPLGRPLDGRPLPPLPHRVPLRAPAPGPMTRQRIRTVLETGVRTIDALLTLGHGQRVGIYAGAGVGKSTLLSMLSMHGAFDVCVVGLVGERGREVREFIEDAINERNRARTCVVAATGDEAPLNRVRGALYATAVAEYFRAQGRNVMLMIDSLTRYAMALREVGLAAGELPATKGYPPSVVVELARLLERAGTGPRGAITGIYTVLVEGDDLSDPVADATRALLDGHIVLSRDLADQGIFPAVDVLASKSRLLTQLAAPPHRDLVRRTVALLADFRQSEDLIRIGAYQKGSDPRVDKAIAFWPKFRGFATQLQSEKTNFATALAQLEALVTPHYPPESLP